MEKAVTKLRAGSVLLLSGLIFAMYRQGGYHEGQHRLFAILCVLSATALLFEQAGRRAMLTMAVVVSPLLASSTVSTLVSEDRSDARSTFLTIGLVGIGLAAGAAVHREQRQLAIDAVILVACIVAVTAIWGVATHTGPWGRVTEGVWRGSSSVTYANAAAAVVGPVAVLTFCLAALQERVVYAAATTLLLAGFASTQSRAGALALVIFIVATVAYLGVERFGKVAPSVAVGTILASAPVLMNAPAANEPQPVLVAVVGLVALASTAALFIYKDALPRPAVTLGALGVIIAIGLTTTSLGASITERLTLRSGTTAGGEDAGVLFGDRGKEWSTAWDRFTDAPLFGHGPGVVDLSWVENDRGFRAKFVHNEYLEFAVTHGVLGLVALAVFAYLIVRLRSDDGFVAPIALATGTYLLHSTFDFLWHVPALPVFFAFLAGLALSVPKTTSN